MKRYVMTVKFSWESFIATDAESKEEAIEEIQSYMNDYQVVFDGEFFEFDDMEVVDIKEEEI